MVQRSIAPLIDGSPHASTNTTSSRYGSHAMKISPAGCRFSATVTGWSPSSRMIVLGRHSFSTATMTTMQVSELMMSVSSGPSVFDT